MVLVGETQGQRLLIARLHTGNAIFKSRYHTPGPKFQLTVLGSTTFKLFAVTSTDIVNVDLITIDCGTLNGLPVALLLTEDLDNIIDILVLDICYWFFHRKALHFQHFNIGEHLEGRNVLHIFPGLQVAGLNAGLASRT